MARCVDVVSRPINDPVLAEVLAPAAAFLQRCESDGVLERCEKAFVMGRRGGHTGRGLSAFLLTYLLTHPRSGIRTFAEKHRRGLERLARMLGLRALPSAAAVSRALGRIDEAQSARFVDQVICSMPGMTEALRRSDVQHLDETGDAWHVVDVDPTVHAFRQRHLESDEERPEAVRLAPGQPGYVGQKRGELRIRSVPVAHAGLGCWLGYRMWSSKVHTSVALCEVVGQGLKPLAAAGVEPNEVIVRMDGEFGNAGCMGRLGRLGVHFVTRLTRYRVLHLPEVIAAIEGREWAPVRGRRAKQAIDLGLFSLDPDAKSADAGEPPVTVRVVASRRAATDSPSHGVEIEGVAYELFATTLPTDRWSSASVVELYLGRAAMENRLAQEDRELGLERTFSFNPDGQALAVGLGLLVWNYLTILGSVDCEEVVADTIPDRSESTTAWMEEHLRPTMSPGPAPDDGSTEDDDNGNEEDAEHRPAPLVRDIPFPMAPTEKKRRLGEILAEAYRDLDPEIWSFKPDEATVTCPNGKALFPFSIARAGPGRPLPQMIIRTATSACKGCPLRARCNRTRSPERPKQIARKLAPKDADWVIGFLRKHRPHRVFATSVPSAPAVENKPVLQEPEIPFYTPLPDPPKGEPRPFVRPTAAPGERRARARHLLFQIRRVEIRLHRLRARRPRVRADSRRGRATWEERRAVWGAPRPASITFEVAPNVLGTNSCPITSLLGGV